MQVPALITGGWYDIFQEGTIRNFMGVREEGGSDAARNGTKLIMRALCHACPGDTTAGEVDFGPDNALDLNAAWARWFDYWLKGIDNGVADDSPVRLFVMTPPDEGTAGGGFWITGDEFPLPDAVETRFYLQSGGGANSAAGDGVLAAEGPGGAGRRVRLRPPRPGFPPSAATCAARTASSPRAPSTRVRWSSAATCWSTPASRWPRT